jgi:hypothetical protein
MVNIDSTFYIAIVMVLLAWSLAGSLLVHDYCKYKRKK